MLLFECSNNKWHRCIIPFFDTTRSQTKRWIFLLFNFIKSLTLICFEISNICGILEDLWTQMRKFSFLIFEYYDCSGRIRNSSLKGLNKKQKWWLQICFLCIYYIFLVFYCGWKYNTTQYTNQVLYNPKCATKNRRK